MSHDSLTHEFNEVRWAFFWRVGVKRNTTTHSALSLFSFVLSSLHHHPRTVISWRCCYWYIWLLDFLQPMKVSGRVEPTAKLATHHLTLMMSLSELVRKPRVDRQFWGGSRTSRSTLDKKNTGEVRKPSSSAAAKKPTAKAVAKQKKTTNIYHFCSRGYL